jgi:hypothetical protein
LTSPVATASRPAGRAVRYQLHRVQRHWYWARTQGLGRLIEEDALNPLDRARKAVGKARWRRAHGVAAGSAVPVFLVGLQRSGTNMVVRGLEASPEFEVHNENDRRAFERFQLRPLPAIRDIVSASRHAYVLFKPLCDSHRTPELLELGAGGPGRAIWAYRSVDGRVASSLAKFGPSNLRALAEIATGRAGDTWQAQGLSAENRALVEGFDYTTMTPASAAALFWYVRNSLFFDLELDRRPDVTLVSYDRFVADPAVTMQGLCRFLAVEWNPALVAHVETRPGAHRPPYDFDPIVREHCTQLQQRLDAVVAQRSVGVPAR